jgi:thiol:disulfide interchange protein
MKKILFLLSFALLISGCQCCQKDKNTSTVSKSETETSKQEMYTQNYKPYTQEGFTTLKGKQPFAVFFYADWCGTCRNWETKVLETNLPERAVILKADYDTETELVKSLKINKQSTAVFFDAEGNVVKKEMDPSMEVLTEYFTQ